MFDSSFPEIVLILLVALVVIGPERLPKLARTIGHWVGRGRSMFNSMREEVEREIQIDELRKAERDLRKDLDLSRDLMEDVEKSGSSAGSGKGPAAAKPGGGQQFETETATGKADASKGGSSSEEHGPKAGS